MSGQLRPNSPYEAYGIQCEGGWARLYEPILTKAQDLGIEILQVKEKFGALRIYYRPFNEELGKMVDAAEAESLRVCEICGAEGKRRTTTGWIRTLCDTHEEERHKA